MIEYKNNRFFRRFIDGTGEVYQGFRFDHCRFDNCSFSNTDDVALRSTARNIEFIECEVAQCDLGPGIVENVTVDGLKTLTMPICWGTLFKHVTLKGSVGDVKINTVTHGIGLDANIQSTFDTDRRRFYDQIDWALDISDARFAEFNARGIPAHLIRIDPASQGAITRESASRHGWRARIRSPNDLWVFVIDEFLKDGDPDLVIAVPKDAPTREYRELLDSFKELKDLGVVL